jgi:hypothetical protein
VLTIFCKLQHGWCNETWAFMRGTVVAVAARFEGNTVTALMYCRDSTPAPSCTLLPAACDRLCGGDNFLTVSGLWSVRRKGTGGGGSRAHHLQTVEQARDQSLPAACLVDTTTAQ